MKFSASLELWDYNYQANHQGSCGLLQNCQTHQKTVVTAKLEYSVACNI